jgi:hypothetical protein
MRQLWFWQLPQPVNLPGIDAIAGVIRGIVMYGSNATTKEEYEAEAKAGGTDRRTGPSHGPHPVTTAGSFPISRPSCFTRPNTRSPARLA